MRQKSSGQTIAAFVRSCCVFVTIKVNLFYNTAARPSLLLTSCEFLLQTSLLFKNADASVAARLAHSENQQHRIVNGTKHFIC